MKKIMLTALLCGAVLFGCGTRKKEVSEIEIKSKKIQAFDVFIDCTAVKTINVDLHQVSDQWTAKPVDNSKPMVINGKAYENAILTNEKKQTSKKYVSNDSIKKKTKNKSNIQEQTSTEVMNSKINRDGSKMIFIYWSIIAIILFVVYWIMNKRR